MKKIQNHTKMKLNKSTIRHLSQITLGGVVGGGPTHGCPTMQITCFSECDCNSGLIVCGGG